jgi:predicted aldo/keto reductase-like oxidoreductase
VSQDLKRKEGMMIKRTLGKTGIEVSALGLGGFHMLEIPKDLVSQLVDIYLAHGGNYIETAAEYGNGESEKKLSYAIKGRRDDIVLASKCHARDKEGARKFVERTLKNLQTDHLDILFLHHVTKQEDVDALLKRPSALDYFLEAKEKGLVKAIGVSFHGLAKYALSLLKVQELDVAMTGFNYYDRFNFPSTFEEFLPYARSKGMGIVGMKAVADGYLYRSPEDAFRYALSQDIDVMVAGANSDEMLLKDISIVENFEPMSQKSMENLYCRAPELGTYVCRQCNKCLPCPEGIDIPKIFLYEGWYDRQMRDYKPHDAPDYALRERLAFWFGNQEEAIEAYGKLDKNVTNCTNCGLCEERCPYDLKITDKLKLVHFKLGNGEIF